MIKFNFGKRSIEDLPTPAKGDRINYGDTKTQFLFLRVTPSNKMFYWQRTIWQKRHIVSIGPYPATSVSVARKRAEVISAEYAMGGDVAGDVKNARASLTLGELWVDFRVNRPRAKGKISSTYEYNWERHFKQWEDMKLSDITYDMARKLILDMRKTAPIHGNRIQAFGKAMWNFAIRDIKWVGDNPFLFSKVSEVGRARSTFRLKRSDMPAFMHALEHISDTMRELFLTSLMTGRRIGEVKSMRWVDIDLVDGIWTLPDTKTGIKQMCIIPKPLVKILLARKERGCRIWVFEGYTQSGHVESVNSAWKKVRTFGFQHLQARDLRGTLVSWLQETGVPLAGAAQQAGHADISTTAQSYTAISQSVLRIGVDSAAEDMLEAAKEK